MSLSSPIVLATHTGSSDNVLNRPLRQRTVNSQTLIEDSHSSFLGSSRTLPTRGARRFESRAIQSQMWVSRSNFIPAKLPSHPGSRWADDVTQDFSSPSHTPESASFALFGRWRHDFGYRLTEAGNSNRLARLANLFQDAEALGFEYGDGYILHVLLRT